MVFGVNERAVIGHADLEEHFVTLSFNACLNFDYAVEFRDVFVCACDQTEKNLLYAVDVADKCLVFVNFTPADDLDVNVLSGVL